jgi:hypothetical protein
MKRKDEPTPERARTRRRAARAIEDKTPAGRTLPASVDRLLDLVVERLMRDAALASSPPEDE